MRADLNRETVRKFMELRHALLPVRSNFYDRLRAIQAHQRVAFHERYSASFGLQLPESTRSFYNNIFENAETFMEPILRDSGIQLQLKDRAREIFSFRLGPTATVEDLLRADVFYGQTQNQDFDIERILSGLSISEADASNWLVRSAYHFFFHRPQQTEFLFLHEIIVGHLVYKGFLRGPAPAVQLFKISEDFAENYWALSSLIFRSYQRFLGMAENDLIALHIADSSWIHQQTSIQFQELIHLSSHVAWYLEFFDLAVLKSTTDETLGILIASFAAPSLELLMIEPRRRMRSQAGAIADQFLCRELFNSDFRKAAGEGARRRPDLKGVLHELVDRLWFVSNETKR